MQIVDIKSPVHVECEHLLEIGNLTYCRNAMITE